MLVPKMTVSWYFSTNFAATKLWLAHYQPKLQYPATRPIIPLRNRVVSLGLALLGAVHKHPKNHNFFACRHIFWTYLYRYMQQPNT